MTVNFKIEGDKIRFSPPVELATGDSLRLIMVSWLGGKSVKDFVATKIVAAEKEVAESENYLRDKLETGVQDYNYWSLDGELYSISPDKTAIVVIGSGGREAEVEILVREKSRTEHSAKIASYDGTGYFGDDDGQRRR